MKPQRVDLKYFVNDGGFDKDRAYYYCRTVEYYKKELYFARKKTKNKTIYPT